MKPVVFVGPTLDVPSAMALLDAEYRPPARQGDILRSVLSGAPAVGLIDGYFERVPSVWHKEILFAIAEGVPVYGASSMGALRASELHRFGMIGVGAVFQSYHKGEIEDDDEVAIQHAPSEYGYIPLSEAMVNIRATVAASVEAEIIESDLADSLLKLAKKMHYKERSYLHLIRDARLQGLDNRVLSEFETWLTRQKVDLKRLDALKLLTVMAEDTKKGFTTRITRPIAVEESLSWKRAREFVFALNRRDVPRWHFSMLGDKSRIAAFDAAIKATVSPGDVVLDIGTGSGLLAMLAARAGASRVFACEGVAVIAEKAREIIEANGLSDRVMILNKRSTDLVVGVDLPERVDVLVSEIVDHVLIGEGIIPTLEHALVQLTKPTAKIIPKSGRLLISAFQCDDLHSRYCLSKAAGFDISLFNEFSPCGASALLQLGEFNLTPLSGPTQAFGFNFSQSSFLSEQNTVPVICKRGGVLHGIVAWFELVLDENNTINNSPWRTDNHWSHEVYLMKYPKGINLGQQIDIHIEHDRTRFRFSAHDQPWTS